MKRVIPAFFVLCASVFMTAGPASADHEDPKNDIESCTGVTHGSDNPNLKKVLLGVDVNAAGDFVLRFRLVSTRAAATVRVRDCIYVQGAGETFLAASFDNKAAVFTTAASGGSTFDFQVTLAASLAGKTVCDRAARSGSQSSGGLLGGALSYTDKSNTVCVPLVEPPVIPEVPYAVVLPIGALALFGAAFVVMRRRGAAGASA